jgi:hypothetical protein
MASKNSSRDSRRKFLKPIGVALPAAAAGVAVVAKAPEPAPSTAVPERPVSRRAPSKARFV